LDKWRDSHNFVTPDGKPVVYLCCVVDGAIDPTKRARNHKHKCRKDGNYTLTHIYTHHTHDTHTHNTELKTLLQGINKDNPTPEVPSPLPSP